MRLVDANLLLYAFDKGFAQHTAAQTWLDELLSRPEPVGLPWPSLLAFVRLTTNPRVFTQPLTVDAAWQQVQQWLTPACVWIPTPTERHREILGQMLIDSQSTANHVPDAHLAALAVEHGLVLCTADTGFARFPGLRYENPLTAKTKLRRS